MHDNIHVKCSVKHLSKREKINSILFAAFISESIICSMIGTLVNIPNISVILSVLFLICIFGNNKGISRRIIPLLLVSGVIILFLLISMVLNGVVNVINYFVYFLCFGMSAVIFVSIKYNTELVYRTLIKIYIFYLTFYLLFIRHTFLNGNTYWNEQMGRAYGFVPIIVFAFAMLLYRNILNTTKSDRLLILFMGMLAFIFLIFDCRTRGALVSTAISFVILLIARETKVKRVALILCFGIGVIYFVIWYREILESVHSFLNAYGINVRALNKMVYMLNVGGADNGRNALFESAKQYFYISPIIGNGIGYFEKMQNSYAHNIFLEILCEFGVIGFSILAGFVITSISLLMKDKINQTKTIGLVFFCISIPMLLFSNSYWLLPQFWIYVFWTIFNYKELRKKTTL